MYLPRLTCKICKWTRTPRKVKITICPKCKSPYSIGQMIQFLSESKSYSWTNYVKEHGDAKNLCDNLWVAVKEVLET